MKLDVNTFKALIGTIPQEETKKDPVLRFILDSVEELIINYCNRDELPDGLVRTAYRMAMDLYRYDCPGGDDIPVVVSSVTTGDTSTSFGSAADALETLAGGVLRNYKGQLNRYRKLRWQPC